jgi:class 3 adenylate cyclase
MTISAHRKVVTVVFCDVVGSTALGESVDPEALQGLLARYFERMKGIVESHGGSVEKFIGDAVMAVFGVPVAHEDDALRACRAAAEMRDALPELGLAARIGVNTGEVLTGTEERLATGDAVNVAARLEQAAEAGEVLIGAETLALVGVAVEVGDERLLELKGKSRSPPTRSPLSMRRRSARTPPASSAASGSCSSSLTHGIERLPVRAASSSRSWAIRASASRGWSQRRWRGSTRK